MILMKMLSLFVMPYANTPSLVFRQTPLEGAPPHPCEGVRGSAPLSPQVTRPPLPRLYRPHDPPHHACSRSRWARSCRRVDESCCRAAALVSSTRPPGELCPCLDMHASPLFLRLADPARLTGLPRARRFTPFDVYLHADGWAGPSRSVAGCMRSCLLYTSPSPRDRTRSRMPSSA